MSAIAIFVKTPGLSPVKSRLAESVGASLAAECHRRCAQAVAAVATQAAVGPVYWAVAEDHPQALEYWTGLPKLVQRGASLGERMQGIHDELVLGHSGGLLLGADLPQVDPESLRQAVNQISQAKPIGVIGPATDGGFWLIGANSRLPANLWRTPSYGGHRVLKDFLAAERSTRRWLRLARRTDLDTLDDLPLVLAELRALPSPHPIQHELIDWLTELAAQPVQPPATASS